MTYDIYFDRCKFTAPSIYNDVLSGGYKTDDYYLYFDSCIFDVKTDSLCQDTDSTYKYHIAKFYNCTGKILKYNDAEIPSTGGGGSVDAYTKTESDDKYQPKGDYITSIKTINGENITGEGNITISGGSTIDAYTKIESDAKYESKGTSYTKSECDNKYQGKGNYITSVKTINGQSITGSGNITVAGQPGMSPTVTTSKSGNTATIKITDAQGDHTFTLKDGENGTNGVSPTLKAERVDTGVKITTTNADGTSTSAIISDGTGTSGGIGDAPSDGNQYVRKDGTWVVNAGGSGSGGIDLSKTVHINLISDSFDKIDDTYPFTFEKGKTYEIHADFSNQPDANEYVGPTMYLSQSGSSKTQSIKTDMSGLVIDATIIANDNYDGFKFNYANSCNVDMTIKFQGTLQEIINNSILESAPKDGITYGLKNGAWSSTSGELIKYPLAEWHPYIDPAYQLVETLTGFTFESGHKYYIDAHVPGDSEWVKANIRLTMKNDSSRFQELTTDHLYGYKGEFTPSQNWDAIYVFNAIGGGADIVVYDIGDTSTMINQRLIPDVSILKKQGENLDGLRNLDRKFSKPYKIAFMGDSITSEQVSDIGGRINDFLGTELIENYACGSATLTNSDSFFYSVDIPFNTWTAYNTIANQVLRQIQRTTAQGSQIKWSVVNPSDSASINTVAIPTSVGTGLGYTEDIPDIVYIAAGINDDMPYLGDFDNIPEVMSCDFNQLDCKTFASALRWAVESLRACYPKVQIFVASPIFTGLMNEHATQADVMTKRKFIQECCAWLSVNFIDSTMKSAYTHQTLVAFPPSDIHPRYYAKAFIAKMVAKEIYNNFIPTLSESDVVY